MSESDWLLVDRIVGLPDFAVAFAVWPWPDGGWMAGVALTDKAWADEQGLSEKLRALPEQFDPPFSIFDGFRDGINVHDTSAAAAIEALAKALDANETEPTDDAARPAGDGGKATQP